MIEGKHKKIGSKINGMVKKMKLKKFNNEKGKRKTKQTWQESKGKVKENN